MFNVLVVSEVEVSDSSVLYNTQCSLHHMPSLKKKKKKFYLFERARESEQDRESAHKRGEGQEKQTS